MGYKRGILLYKYYQQYYNYNYHDSH